MDHSQCLLFNKMQGRILAITLSSLHATVQCVIFYFLEYKSFCLKKWANPGLFYVYFRSFLITISIIPIEKSIDVYAVMVVRLYLCVRSAYCWIAWGSVSIVEPIVESHLGLMHKNLVVVICTFIKWANLGLIFSFFLFRC